MPNSYPQRTPPNGFVKVTRKAFFESVGQLDVHPSTEMPHETAWKLRSGRVIGWDNTGWKGPYEYEQDEHPEEFYVAPEYAK